MRFSPYPFLLVRHILCFPRCAVHFKYCADGAKSRRQRTRNRRDERRERCLAQEEKKNRPAVRAEFMAINEDMIKLALVICTAILGISARREQKQPRPAVDPGHYLPSIYPRTVPASPDLDSITIQEGGAAHGSLEPLSHSILADRRFFRLHCKLNRGQERRQRSWETESSVTAIRQS